jgi:hypothetical protein
MRSMIMFYRVMNFSRVRGTGLLEVTVSLGIFALIALSAAKYISSKRQGIAKIESEQLKSSLRRYIREFTNCEISLKNQPSACEGGGNINLKQDNGKDLLSKHVWSNKFSDNAWMGLGGTFLMAFHSFVVRKAALKQWIYQITRMEILKALIQQMIN